MGRGGGGRIASSSLPLSYRNTSSTATGSTSTYCDQHLQARAIKSFMAKSSPPICDKSTKIGPVLRTNIREQYGTSTSKFCVNIQYSGAGPQLLCTTMKIQPKSMHLLKILKYLNKSV